MESYLLTLRSNFQAESLLFCFSQFFLGNLISILLCEFFWNLSRDKYSRKHTHFEFKYVLSQTRYAVSCYIPNSCYINSIYFLYCDMQLTKHIEGFSFYLQNMVNKWNFPWISRRFSHKMYHKKIKKRGKLN